VKPTLDVTTLPRHVAGQFKRLVRPGERCLVAVSGGPDSIALLDLLHNTVADHHITLCVAHVDHNIHPESAAVAATVAAAAGARGLPFHQRNVALGAQASETTARVVRRLALREMAEEADCDVIALGHHADDQAETVLMRLLRGSGPAGLAAMRLRRGPWIRPLLDVRRRTLADYLVSRQLSAWQDPANSDSRHLRSWLRADILPLLAERLPDVVQQLTQTASQSAIERDSWAAAVGILPGLESRPESNGISVAAPVLQGYRSGLRHAVLAALGRQVGVLLGARRMAAIDRLLAGSASGSVSLAARWRAELSFGRLAFVRSALEGSALSGELSPGSDVNTSTMRIRCAAARSGPASRVGWSTDVVPGRYVVRSWQSGDRMFPLGGSGSRSLAVLFREAMVPPSRRQDWPVMVNAADATIVWVPGICRSDACLATEGNEAWNVDCVFA
jgi:tRNA(Ile)-lysidine synthase